VLSGSGALVKSITPDKVGVRLDLSKTSVGRNTFTITSDNISLPPGIVLREVTPSEVDVLIDETIKKEVPVQIDWVGALPDNLILVDAITNPSTIEVAGSKRILEDITTIYTEKVLLDQLSGRGEFTANLVLSPASLKIASGAKGEVTIQYLIRERE
jgi:YbbR domain-containing protein